MNNSYLQHIDHIHPYNIGPWQFWSLRHPISLHRPLPEAVRYNNKNTIKSYDTLFPKGAFRAKIPARALLNQFYTHRTTLSLSILIRFLRALI